MLLVPPLHAPPRLPHRRGWPGDEPLRVPQHLLPRLLQVNIRNIHSNFLETSPKKATIMHFRVVTAAERPTVPTDTTVLMADDDKDGCPRCGGMVSVNFILICRDRLKNGPCCMKRDPAARGRRNHATWGLFFSRSL